MRPRLVALLGAAVLLTGCKDSSGPGGLSLSRIAGTWDLIAWDALLVSDTTQQVDFLATFGAATITITQGGSLTLSIDGVDIGTIPVAVRDNRVILGDAGSEIEYEVTLSPTGSVMSWLGVAVDNSVDVDGDGTRDMTRERYHWVKV